MATGDHGDAKVLKRDIMIINKLGIILKNWSAAASTRTN